MLILMSFAFMPRRLRFSLFADAHTFCFIIRAATRFIIFLVYFFIMLMFHLLFRLIIFSLLRAYAMPPFGAIY